MYFKVVFKEFKNTHKYLPPVIHLFRILFDWMTEMHTILSLIQMKKDFQVGTLRLRLTLRLVENEQRWLTVTETLQYSAQLHYILRSFLLTLIPHHSFRSLS